MRTLSRQTTELPSALEATDVFRNRLRGKSAVLLLDYDGTLTPIVEQPDQALLSDDMRRLVQKLANLCPVAIVSGRDLRDVQDRVGIDSVSYAGSHGFEILGPSGAHKEHDEAVALLPLLDEVEHELGRTLASFSGALVERKRFSISAHYRRVPSEQEGPLEGLFDRILSGHPQLCKGHGKKVFEVLPRLDWNKGQAALWILEALGLERDRLQPFYIGDDRTDEDVFLALAGWGIGIVVAKEPRPTSAEYVLEDPGEVGRFLSTLATLLESP